MEKTEEKSTQTPNLELLVSTAWRLWLMWRDNQADPLERLPSKLDQGLPQVGDGLTAQIRTFRSFWPS